MGQRPWKRKCLPKGPVAFRDSTPLMFIQRGLDLPVDESFHEKGSASIVRKAGIGQGVPLAGAHAWSSLCHTCGGLAFVACVSRSAVLAAALPDGTSLRRCRSGQTRETTFVA